MQLKDRERWKMLVEFAGKQGRESNNFRIVRAAELFANAIEAMMIDEHMDFEEAYEEAWDRVSEKFTESQKENAMGVLSIVWKYGDILVDLVRDDYIGE